MITVKLQQKTEKLLADMAKASGRTTDQVAVDAILEAIEDWKARLAKIVERGIRCGEIRKGTSPRRVANVVIATLEGALAISRMEGTRTALEDALQALDVFLDGIAA